MRSVGVRELKQRASAILKQLQADGEPIDVTHRGRVVARLIPAESSAAVRENWQTFWADWDKLAAEISADWPEGVSALDAVNDVRRHL